ncbi:M15 family metallopeptidase [Aneurinibacillus aneurinilyticus]|uniref:M15 family metallopeptidase n=1 Tax=Aneurinibacillus aneurinilyticus TaxID=1391 RepID=UPI003524738F
MKHLRNGLILACMLSTITGASTFAAPSMPATTNTEALPLSTTDVGYGSIPTAIEQKITGISFTKKTPVKMSDLSYVCVRYIGFDDKAHTGELIVHKMLAKDVFEIFEELYQKRYPIEKVNLIDEYKGSDELSMKANNSSAFNTRAIDGKKKMSNHSYGIAIDINPLQNPHVVGNKVNPASSKEYANRKVARKGMIMKGDACYNAFKKRGWSWGGEWKSSKDYQHFEKKIK